MTRPLMILRSSCNALFATWKRAEQDEEHKEKLYIITSWCYWKRRMFQNVAFHTSPSWCCIFLARIPSTFDCLSMWARVYVVVCFMWRNCGRSEFSRTLIAQGRRQSTTYTKMTDSMRLNFVIASFASSSSMSMLSTFVLNFISCFSVSLSRFVHFLICPFSFFILWSCEVLVSMCRVPLTQTERKIRKHALFF